ncbi:MAG TPA: phosphoglucosamine mutase, partial [Candidatus Nitrosotenuis sp.]|nr:phosphoglucosamine mutase [Candidatus Nitrosotenuis sp.]
FDEKNWVMIRPSGTEPIARIYAEADSDSRLSQTMSQYLKKTKSVLGN